MMIQAMRPAIARIRTMPMATPPAMRPMWDFLAGTAVAVDDAEDVLEACAARVEAAEPEADADADADADAGEPVVG
jgi:hypothetical protein